MDVLLALQGCIFGRNIPSEDRLREEARRCRESSDPGLRLAGVLVNFSADEPFRLPDGLSRKDICDLLTPILADPRSVQYQDLAAYALAWLYLSCTNNWFISDKTQPELPILIEHLGDSTARYAALLGLTIIHENQPDDSWCTNAELPRALAGVLSDDTVPVSDQIRALTLSGWFPSLAEVRAGKASSLLRSCDVLTAEVAGLLGILLGAGRDDDLIAMLASPSVPLARRQRLLTVLAARFSHCVDWATWKPIIFAQEIDPELRAGILRLFATRPPGAHLTDFVAMARDPGLPLPCRIELFETLWLNAEAIEQQIGTDTPIIDELLQLGSVPDVARRVFSKRGVQFRGRMNEELRGRVLAAVRDGTLPVSYRYLLGCGVLFGTALDTDATKLIVDVGIRAALARADIAAGDAAERIWEDLHRHAGKHADVARYLCEDERVPMARRLALLRHVPRESIQRLAQSPAFPDTERAKLTEALYYHVPEYFWSVWERVTPGHDRLELLTPALLSDSPDALPALCADPEQPADLRWLAAEWAVTAATDSCLTPRSRDDDLENLPLAALAMLIARARPDDPRRLSYRALLAERLSRVDTDSREAGFLVAFLLRHAEPILAELCGNDTLSPARRTHILQQVARETNSMFFSEKSRTYLDWATWRDVVLRPTEAQVWERLVDLFARNRVGEHWTDLLVLAKQPNLPASLRAVLFRGIWSAANQIEARNAAQPLFPLLTTLGSDPSVVEEAFHDRYIPGYGGTVDDSGVLHILTVCRDQTKTAPYRCLFAQCAPSVATLAPADRATIVQALVDGMSASDETRRQVGTSIWDLVKDHASREPRLARTFFFDERIPFAVRLCMLKYSDPQSILWAMQNPGLTDRERYDVCQLLQHYVPWSIWVAVREDLLTRGKLWRAVCQTPAFFGYDNPALIEIALDSQQPDQLRSLAQHWALQNARTTPEGVTPLLGDIIAKLTEDAITPEALKLLIDYTTVILSDRVPQEEEVTLIAGALRNDAIPRDFRLALLRSLPTGFLRSRGTQTRLWKILSGARDRYVRAAAFEKLTVWGDFVTTREAQEINERLRNAQTPEEIAAAEQEWQALARLAVLIDTDIYTLIQIARDPAEPEIVRENAIHGINDRPRENSRRLWAYIASAEGKSIWEDPTLHRRLRAAVVHYLSDSLGNLRLHPIVNAGPHGPLWDGLVQLVLLPDQSLARHALRHLHLPQSDDLLTWRETVVPDVPHVALLPLADLCADSADQRGAALFNQAFRACRGRHARNAELTDSVVRTLTAPPCIRKRVTSVVEKCAIGNVDTPQEKARLVDDLIRVLRFSQIEAQMLAQESSDSEVTFDRIPDLPETGLERLTRFDGLTDLGTVASRLRNVIIERLQRLLPEATASQLDRVLQETEAPAVLASHYQQTHPTGIPLLAQIVRAEGDGEDRWKEWRYDRPEARRQLPQLTSEHLVQWRQNLSIPVEVEAIPDEVRDAARQIRTRFQQALRDREIPEQYTALLRDMLHGAIAPAEQIRRLEDVKGVVGRYLGGELEPRLAGADLRLSEALRKEVASLSDSPETVAARRQALLLWRYRLDRAIDLVRLLHCDESTLARNVLLAVGEDAYRVAHTESAVAHFDKMLHAFTRPPTRQQQPPPTTEVSALANALSDARAVVKAIKTFATGRGLLAVECDDFKTLIEIGHTPYGQGSCQNYASRSGYNQALLAYTVDAMTKAIVIQTAPTSENPRGTLLARAIVRLGTNELTGEPVLLLEKTYAAGRETSSYDPLIRKAARTFAAQRGWLAVVPKTKTETAIHVRIPASQNGVQYEDGHEAMVGGSTALPNQDYVLQSVAF